MDYIILGVDSLIVAGLYYIYRHKKNIISNVEVWKIYPFLKSKYSIYLNGV